MKVNHDNHITYYSPLSFYSECCKHPETHFSSAKRRSLSLILQTSHQIEGETKNLTAISQVWFTITQNGIEIADTSAK